MSQQRLAKFRKLQHLTEQQLDLILLELAAKRTELDQLHRLRQELQTDLTRIQSCQVNDRGVTTSRQLAFRQLELTQDKITHFAKEISTVEQQLHQIIRRYQEQNSKLKSWQKLVDKEAGRVLQEQTKQEFDNADERFLSTTETRRA